MKKLFFVITLNLFLFALCKEERDPVRIMQKTISSIDKISSISYNQNLIKTNPDNTAELIERDQSFICKKLPKDSITGAKSHIYYYSEGVVVYEDIYNGQFLIRKNLFDSTVAYYDLLKYPEFKKSDRFWRKTTPFTIQALLNFTLKNQDEYKIELLKDTLIDNTECYCVLTTLKNKNTISGINVDFTKNQGIIESSYFYLDKTNYYPIKLRFEQYNINNPENIFITDHQFSDIIFNPNFKEKIFSAQHQNLKGYKINYMVTTKV